MKEDIVICPSCAKTVPKSNNGCDHCGYEWCNRMIVGDDKRPWRIPAIRDILEDSSGYDMDAVSVKFLIKIAEWGFQYGRTIHPK